MSRDEKQTLLPKERDATQSRHILAIYGGVGTTPRDKSSPERQGLCTALQSGNAIVSTGGEAMDVVVAAISVKEGEWHLRKVKLKPILTSVQCGFQKIHFF